jgi:hypothetical protein
MATALQEKVVTESKTGSDASNTPSFADETDENPTGISEKALLRKLDYKLLPGLTLLYLLSFLDRSNSIYPPSTPSRVYGSMADLF